MHQNSTVTPREARDHDAFEVRLAKLVADIGALVTITVKSLYRSKLQTVRALGVAVGQKAFTLRLSISMERPA